MSNWSATSLRVAPARRDRVVLGEDEPRADVDRISCDPTRPSSRPQVGHDKAGVDAGMQLQRPAQAGFHLRLIARVISCNAKAARAARTVVLVGGRYAE
jgi:hypothetical protein